MAVPAPRVVHDGLVVQRAERLAVPLAQIPGRQPPDPLQLGVRRQVQAAGVHGAGGGVGRVAGVLDDLRRLPRIPQQHGDHVQGVRGDRRRGTGRELRDQGDQVLGRITGPPAGPAPGDRQERFAALGAAMREDLGVHIREPDPLR
ncbi:hypothetical protein ACH4T9_24185 [Micromonospora sp. NPDC020750]|uniref:hypothetical protein n=1 Tax=unclassified Micromonospora TaxID=2617518 RepID=UPI0037A7A9C7